MALPNPRASEQTMLLQEKQIRNDKLKKHIMCHYAVVGRPCIGRVKGECQYNHTIDPDLSLPCQFGEACEDCLKRNWEADECTNRCRGCAKEFTLIVRRSHCRCCGRCFDRACLSELEPIGKVCTPCRSKLLAVEPSACPCPCSVQ